MKNTKHILISILSAVALMTSQASFASATNFANKSAELLKKTQGPGFELFNKAATIITVRLVIGGTTKTEMILPQQKFEYKIDLNTPVRLDLYNQGLTDAEIRTARPQRTVSINAPGKTKYLTWNPAKAPYLYPQTGPLMGLLSRTSSGYPLSMNLKQSDIR